MRFISITLVSISLFTLLEVISPQSPPFFPTRSVVFAKEKESTSPDTLLSWRVDLSADLYASSLNRPVAHDEVDANQPSNEPTTPPTPIPPTATPSIIAATSRTQPNDAPNPAYGQVSPLPLTGLAMYYNPNVMREVVANRVAMGHLSSCGECIGHVALLRVGDLNRRVWLQWADGKVEGPFLVADVAAAHHVAYLLERNWVVDVDYQTAVRRGMAGPVAVTVLAGPSATAPHVVEAGIPENLPVSTDKTSAETVIATATVVPTALPLQYATSPPATTPEPPSEVTLTPVHLALLATSAPTALPYPYDLDETSQRQAVEPIEQSLPTALPVPATATPMLVPLNSEPAPTPLPYPYER